MPKPIIVEGQTATNPQTGEKIVYRGGKWFPAGASATQGGKLLPQEEIALKDARDSANMFTEVSTQAEQFGKLNEKVGTGPIYKIPGAKSIANIFNPDMARMEALSARMAPAQRVPGSGTTSDRDLALFLKAVPDVERMGSGNAGIIEDMKSMATKRQQRAYFLDRYAQQTGTLKGAEEAFAKEWAAKSAKPRATKGPVTSGSGWKVIP
jgi:hypothetical protein